MSAAATEVQYSKAEYSAIIEALMLFINSDRCSIRIDEGLGIINGLRSYKNGKVSIVDQYYWDEDGEEVYLHTELQCSYNFLTKYDRKILYADLVRLLLARDAVSK